MHLSTNQSANTVTNLSLTLCRNRHRTCGIKGAGLLLEHQKHLLDFVEDIFEKQFSQVNGNFFYLICDTIILSLEVNITVFVSFCT